MMSLVSALIVKNCQGEGEGRREGASCESIRTAVMLLARVKWGAQSQSFGRKQLKGIS